MEYCKRNYLYKQEVLSMKDNESWHSIKIIGIVAIVAIVAIVGFIIGRGSIGSGSSSDSSSGDIAGKAYGSSGNYFVVSGTSDNSYDAAAIMLQNNKDMTKWYWSIGGGRTPDVLDDLLLKYGKGNTYAGPYLTVKKESGNVGIGTATPSEKLEVSGNIKASGPTESSGKLSVYNLDVTSAGDNIRG